MAPSDASDKGIHIENAQGAISIGNHNTVTHIGDNVRGAPPAVDPAQEELLRVVRELRADLDRFVRTPEAQALSTELADTEGEITGTGAATPGRLARLRTALADASAVVGLASSGAAAVQAVGALLGG
ncbi:hypothetical protein ACFVFQ_19675 [Streptomyces sp. NPDC057743]|uniref:hypothetical protein n=1 Tax=Streptomyces sp. NPDC057743 TaxID=3346236 RepID=UPI00367A2153